jgi:hypothetical protein
VRCLKAALEAVDPDALHDDERDGLTLKQLENRARGILRKRDKERRAAPNEPLG